MMPGERIKEDSPVRHRGPQRNATMPGLFFVAFCVSVAKFFRTHRAVSLGLHFCLLHFASCLLPCSSVMAAPIILQTGALTEPVYLTPVEIKLSGDGKQLYVVCEDSDSLLSVDTQTRQVRARVAVGHKPKGLAISPDGATLYVSNEWSDTVSEIDAATFVVKRTLKTGWGPVGLVTDRSARPYTLPIVLPTAFP